MNKKQKVEEMLVKLREMSRDSIRRFRIQHRETGKIKVTNGTYIMPFWQSYQTLTLAAFALVSSKRIWKKLKHFCIKTDETIPLYEAFEAKYA